MKLIKFHDPVYKVMYIVFFGVPGKRMAEWSEKMRVVIEPEAWKNAGLSATLEGNSAYDERLIWTSTKDMGCLMHEVIHAAMGVMKDRGVDVVNSEDSLTYYAEWIFNMILEKNKHKAADTPPETPKKKKS